MFVEPSVATLPDGVIVVLEKFAAARQPGTSVNTPKPEVRMLLVRDKRLTSLMPVGRGAFTYLLLVVRVRDEVQVVHHGSVDADPSAANIRAVHPCPGSVEFISDSASLGDSTQGSEVKV
jgi:hypothetical protein